MTEPPPELYVGGALPPGALYIERAADRALVEALRAGIHCHVLAPRQVGKTSLRIRARAVLECDPQAPRRCASVDFTALGTAVVESDEAQDRWYLSLAAEMGRGLGINTGRIAEHWKGNAGLRGVDRWSRVVRELFLGPESGEAALIFFFDEINALLRLRFRGEWLGALRALHNERATNPQLARLTFCLIGFARAEDLVPDMVNNPFDITKTISLEDFTRAELDQARPAVVLALERHPTGAEGQPSTAQRADALLNAVHAWTSGHPMMTVALLRAALAQPPAEPSREALLGAVESLFPRVGLQAHPLLTAAATYLQSDWAQAPMARTQALYARLLAGDAVPARANDPVQGVLRIAGVAAEHGGMLQVRNAIFARALDAAWIAEHLNRRPLHEAAGAWDAAGRGGIALPSARIGAELQAWSEDRTDLTELEVIFLRALQQRRQRRVVGLVIAGAVVTVALLAAGALAAITTFRLRAHQAQDRVVLIENVTQARRAADEIVIGLAKTEFAARNSLDDAVREQQEAQSVLSLIRSGVAEAVATGPAGADAAGRNQAVENLRRQVAELTTRAGRLQGELDRARGARERAERHLEASSRAALETPQTPSQPPPNRDPHGAPPQVPPDPPDAGPTTAAVVEAVAAQQATLRTEMTNLAGDTSRMRSQLLDVVRAEVLTPRQVKPRPPALNVPTDVVEARLCVTAVSLANRRLEAENRRLCEVAECVESRNLKDTCLGPDLNLEATCR